ncbi:MAG: choice-of-anchor D domain-containing protein [Myxococcota bacterium]
MGRLGAAAITLSLLGGLACEEDSGAVDVLGDLRGPGTLDLGDLPQGLTLERTVELRNIGSGGLTLTSGEVLESATGQQISITQNPAGTRLDPGQALLVPVQIQMLATQEEPVDALLRFTADAGGLDQTETVVLRSRGADRTLLVRPQPLDFGSVRVGTRVRRTVEVVNLLSQPVDLLVPFASGEARFEEGDRLFDLLNDVAASRGGSVLPEGVRLQPAEAFELEFEYAPAANSTGERDRGRLQIRSCPQDFCLNEIDLQGRGVRSGLSCDPAEVGFGALRPGRFESTFVRCTNVSNVDIEVLNWELAEASDEEFSIEPFSGAGVVYRPGDTFEFEVSFSPTPDRLGEALFGRIDVSARTPEDVAPTIRVEIPVEGSPGGPVAVLVPNPIPMGEVAVGQLGRAPLTLSNAGFADLDIQGVRFEGGDAEAMSLNLTPQLLSEQRSLDLVLSFEPTVAGPIEATLILETNDPLQPELRVDIVGTALGLDLDACAIQSLPPQVEFGLVPVGATTERTFAIRNVGTGACILREFSLSASTEVFDYVRAPFPSAVVDVGGTEFVSVRFSPVAEREYNSAAEFKVSRTQPDSEIPLAGSGGLGRVLVSPTELDYGNVRLGCVAPEREVQLRNISGQQIGVRVFELAGDPEFEFGLLPPGLPPQPGQVRPMEPGQFFEIPIQYRPTEEGEHFAVLRVEVDGQNGSNTVQIRGRSSDRNQVVQTFSQSENPKVDLLWVIDNSFSMEQEIDFLRATADDIFQALVDAGVDYQTSVISTDFIGSQTSPCGFVGSSPQGEWRRGSCGFFSDGDEREQRNEWRIVDRFSVPTPADVFRRVTDLPFPGPNIERGLQSMVSALTPPQVLGWNRDFIRPDADLAVIILSDEEDQSPGTVDSYISALQALKPGNDTSFRLSAVVPPDTFRCITGQPLEECPSDFLVRIQNNYRQAALLTNGVALSSALDPTASDEEQRAQYADIIFDATFASISLRSLFPLRDTPAPGSLLVLVDGVPQPPETPGGVNWIYDGAANRIQFTDRGLPSPGTRIEVRYDALCITEE